MGSSRPTGEWTEGLLEELVADLGYSMIGRVDGIVDWLRSTPDLTADDIAVRVLNAEGIDPVSGTGRDLEMVRACAAKWLARAG
jgi:hypothetical protein